MLMFSRRPFLASASATSLVGAAASSNLSTIRSAVAGEPSVSVLRVVARTIEVNGRSAKVYGLHQPDGTSGFFIPTGRFRVRLESQIDAPTLVHWHGLTPP